MPKATVAGCDQCQVLVINGVACHEHGCPKSWINPRTGEPYKKKCDWCGCEFFPEERGQRFCSYDCAENYW